MTLADHHGRQHRTLSHARSSTSIQHNPSRQSLRYHYHCRIPNQRFPPSAPATVTTIIVPQHCNNGHHKHINPNSYYYCFTTAIRAFWPFTPALQTTISFLCSEITWTRPPALKSELDDYDLSFSYFWSGRRIFRAGRLCPFPFLFLVWKTILLMHLHVNLSLCVCGCAAIQHVLLLERCAKSA